jgi:hypothetical protein
MRLIVEYFKSASIHMDQLNNQELESPSFHNYVRFSHNVLAASTTINSTVTNSKVFCSFKRIKVLRGVHLRGNLCMLNINISGFWQHCCPCVH